MTRALHLALLIGVLALTGFMLGPTPVHAAVAASVQVVNPDNASVPTHDAGQPQPVNGGCTAAAIALLNVAHCDMYTVPAGKRLVVEMFSYWLISDASNAAPFRVAVGLDTGYAIIASNVLWFAPAYSAHYSGGTSYADTRAIRLYFDEGQKVQAEADFSDANIYDQSFHFSGFLTYK